MREYNEGDEGGEMKELRIVFDGPPGHDSPRFVETEDELGRGVGEGGGD